MGYFQKEADRRKRRIAAARQWATAQGKPDDGFAEWCWDTGREGDHTAAHAVWMTSPARIEWWAERHGIFVGRGFARWYLETGRADTFAEAYEVYRAMVHAEAEAARVQRRAV